MDDQRCATCRFWRYSGDDEDGECRRRAPRSFIGPPLDTPGFTPHVTVRWPVTLQSEWCGEWAAEPGANGGT